MEKLNYKQAYNLIIDAYFKDEIKPYDADFCFCGTLAEGSKWYHDFTRYSEKEYDEMENALFAGIDNCSGIREIERAADKRKHPHFEDALFSGMCAALEVLKEIHRSRNEDVDNLGTVFTKRELLPKDRTMSGQEV